MMLFKETSTKKGLQGAIVCVIGVGKTEFQDYRVLNQKLAMQLEKFDIKDIPRFGEDPRKRIENYIKYFPEGNISNLLLTGDTHFC